MSLNIKPFMVPPSNGLSSQLVKSHLKHPNVGVTTKGCESSVGPISHLPDRSLHVPRTSQMAPDAYIKQ